jgi:nitrate reductase NapE component
MVINSYCVIVVTFGATNGIVLFDIVLVKIYGLFGFILWHRYLFNLGAIFNIYPQVQSKIGFQHLSTNILKYLFYHISLLWETTNS